MWMAKANYQSIANPAKGEPVGEARLAQSGLPTGAENGTSSGQDASTERQRSLTALSNASGSFRRSRATPVRGSTASVEATEAARKMAAASQLQRRTADGAATTRGVSLEDAGARAQSPPMETWNCAPDTRPVVNPRHAPNQLLSYYNLTGFAVLVRRAHIQRRLS